tara:strand:+ start:285 stop:788 length:504 start_codon:yes stop_codon:yes gene_type:complete
VVNSFEPGTILWFKPESGRGVVKLDQGRQYFFERKCGIDDPVKGLRVLVRMVEGEQAATSIELKLPAGGRSFAEPEPPPRPKRRASTKTKKPSGATSRRPKTGPKTGVVKRVVRKGESLERGISVAHPVHGHGFVVLSTSSMARIRFMPSQEERSIRIDDLEILEKS